MATDLKAIEGSLLNDENEAMTKWLNNIAVSPHDSVITSLVKKAVMKVTLYFIIGCDHISITNALSAVPKVYKQYWSERAYMHEAMRRAMEGEIDRVSTATNLNSAIEHM